MKIHFSIIGLALVSVLSFGSIACRDNKPEKNTLDGLPPIIVPSSGNISNGSIPTYEQPGETSDDSHYREIIGIAIGKGTKNSDIDNFWRGDFGFVSNNPYVSPNRLIPYRTSRPPVTACPYNSVSELAGNAFYCPADMSISWDEDWFLQGYTRFSRQQDMFPLIILAHEWGHHIQKLAVEPTFSIQAELQADCYAGAYLNYAATRSRYIRLEEDDVEESIVAFFNIGDKNFQDSNWFAEGIHGRPADRQAAFARAFISGDVRQCQAYARFTPQAPIQLGGYTLMPLPATTYKGIGNSIFEFKTRSVSGQMKFMPQLSATAASEQIRTVAREWFGNSQARFIGDVKPQDGLLQIGDTTALQRYEQVLIDEYGRPKTIHGSLFLHIRPGGGGLIFDVFQDGVAPTNAASWKNVEDMLFVSLFGVKVR